MVLSHGNQGKYLSKRFHEATDEYYDDPNNLTSEMKTWVEYSTIRNAYNSNEDNWLIDKQPTNWPEGSEGEQVDVRKVKNLED